MQVCRRCGSIRTRVIKGGVVDRLLSLVLRQHVVICSRCGWQGRRSRSLARQATSARPVGSDAEHGRGHVPLNLAELDRVLEAGPARLATERRRGPGQ